MKRFLFAIAFLNLVFVDLARIRKWRSESKPNSVSQAHSKV